MTDFGITCGKGNYGRGIGTTLGCIKEKEKSGLMCYETCKDGYEGTLNFCFSVCPAGTTACGPALCIADGESCSLKVLTMVRRVVTTVLKAAQIISPAVLFSDAAGLIEAACDTV